MTLMFRGRKGEKRSVYRNLNKVLMFLDLGAVWLVSINVFKPIISARMSQGMSVPIANKIKKIVDGV